MVVKKRVTRIGNTSMQHKYIGLRRMIPISRKAILYIFVNIRLRSKPS